MDRKEEREIEAKVKEEKGMGLAAENLYGSVANGLPNEEDNGGNYDALNATYGQGGIRGTHITDINKQTDLELGGLMDPGGIDAAMDQQFLENMAKNIKKNQ